MAVAAPAVRWQMMGSSSPKEKWATAVAWAVIGECRPTDPVVVLNAERSVDRDLARRLVCLAKKRKIRVYWNGAIDQLPATNCRVIVLKCGAAERSFEDLAGGLSRAGRWDRGRTSRYSFIPPRAEQAAVHCEVRSWVAQ